MAGASETLTCFGKINLFLEIHDRRADGYHDLGTLFQTVACADRLAAESWDGIELACPEGITARPEENLVLKAARLMQEAYRDRIGGAGIRFTLEKFLPTGAGLGGGSSDAAGALVLCNRVWNLGLETAELIPHAARLGADVPFFLYGGCCFAEGKGENLRPAPAPFPFEVVIATPHSRVGTAWAYDQLDTPRKREWERFKALYVTYCEDWEFYQVLRNDFDAPMQRHFPDIRSLSEAMRGFSPVKTLVSGSGASVFALFREPALAESCLESVKDSCRFACRTRFVD